MSPNAASIILAAGRGSRMENLDTNKALLPLAPGRAPRQRDYPMLLQIIRSLPPGPKAVVVHYRRSDVIDATNGLGLIYCDQPVLNGTGGALLAAEDFLRRQDHDTVVLTMGDVPLVKRETYNALIERLARSRLVVLGFHPRSRKQYGLLEVEGDRVRRIIEWEYWKDLSPTAQKRFHICNSGIYAARRTDLLNYLPVLRSKPHTVWKQHGGIQTEIEEFFVTDLVEYMDRDGLRIGYEVVQDETEVIGVDDPSSLKQVRKLFQARLEAAGTSGT